MRDPHYYTGSDDRDDEADRGCPHCGYDDCGRCERCGTPDCRPCPTTCPVEQRKRYLPRAV